MSAQRSPPLWKLPDLRRQGNTTPSPIDSVKSTSSEACSMTSELHLYRQKAAGGSPEQSQSQTTGGGTTLINPPGPIIDSPKALCCPFASLRATSLRLQSNEHTWDTLLLRFLRLEPGEVIHSPSRNHVVQVSVSKTRIPELLPRMEPQGQAKANARRLIDEMCRTRYFGIHLVDGINPPAPPASSSPVASSTKPYARGRYIELPLSQEFVERLNHAGSICFWCNEHGLWYEVSILSGCHEGTWRDSARSSPVL